MPRSAEQLQSDFARLKAYLEGGDEESIRQVNEWEGSVKKALLKDNLSAHDGVKMILDEYQNQVNQINIQLQENEQLTDDDRKYLFARKRWCLSFINIFTVARSTIAGVEKALDESVPPVV